LVKRRTKIRGFRDFIVRVAGSSGAGSWLRRIWVDAGVSPGTNHREVASLRNPPPEIGLPGFMAPDLVKYHELWRVLAETELFLSASVVIGQ
jgi:hypothetical protein